MEYLATVEELAARAAMPLPLSEQDEATAQSCLRRASSLVRQHGLPWPDPEAAPELAKTTTVEAALRGFVNPAGFDMERGDAVTFNRNEVFAQGVYLTRGEKEELATFKPQTGLVSMPTVNTDQLIARSSGDGLAPPWARGYAPDAGGQKPWPLGW